VILGLCSFLLPKNSSDKRKIYFLNEQNAKLAFAAMGIEPLTFDLQNAQLLGNLDQN